MNGGQLLLWVLAVLMVVAEWRYEGRMAEREEATRDDHTP